MAPRVPEYQSNVSLRPIFQQGVDVRASPQAFGSDIGRGMQQAAQGVMQLSSSLEEVQQLEDVMRAKEADNNYANWLRERQYGENGYMTLSGRTAVDSRKTFEEEAAAKRKEFGSGLNSGAARAYQSASTARLQSTYQQSIVHSANERKTWFKDASNARVETFANDALVNYDKPDLFNKAIAAGQLELRERGQMEGWDAATLKQRESEYTSGVYKNATLRMAQADPLKAEKFMRENQNRLSGADQYALQTSLEGAINEETSKRETERILGTGRKVSEVPGDIVAEVAGVKPERPATGGGPTKAKAFLASRSVHKNRPGDTTNLDNNFADNLAALLQDAPAGIREGLGLGSAFRDNERQKELFENSDKSGKYVAFPAGYKKPNGTIAQGSNHLHGRAVDLTYNGQRLDKAPQEVRDWVHSNAKKYGLFFPMGHEPWHIEPTRGEGSSTVAARSDNIAPRSTMPSYGDIEAQLGQISDPKVRDLTRKRLYTAIEMQNKAFEQNEKAAKATLWSYVDKGMSPDQIPSDVKQAAGMAAVSAAWGYMESAAKGRDPTTDEILMRDMQLYAARDPKGFANDIDLNDYRDKISKGDLRKLTDMQASALTQDREAAQKGTVITEAFTAASGALEAVGITTTGKKDEEREAAAKRIAQFQNQLAQEIAQFQQQNNNRAPTFDEQRAMVNKMLLPIIIKQEKSAWNPTKTPWTSANESNSFMFETGGKVGDLGAGVTAELNVQYKDIPIPDRIAVEQTLEKQLGFKPSAAQVEVAYEQYLLDRK